MHNKKYAADHVVRNYNVLIDAVIPRGTCRVTRYLETSTMDAAERVKYCLSRAFARYFGPEMRTPTHILHQLLETPHSERDVRPGHIAYWLKLHRSRGSLGSPLLKDLDNLPAFRKEPSTFRQWVQMNNDLDTPKIRGSGLWHRDHTTPFSDRIKRYRYLTQPQAHAVYLIRTRQTFLDNKQTWAAPNKKKIIPVDPPNAVNIAGGKRKLNPSTSRKRRLEEADVYPDTFVPPCCDFCGTMMQENEFVFEHLVMTCEKFSPQRSIFLSNTPISDNRVSKFQDLLSDPKFDKPLLAFIGTCKIPIFFNSTSPGVGEPDSTDDPD